MAASTLAHPDGPGRGDTPASQVYPRFHLLLPNEPVAMDIEFQDYKDETQLYPMYHEDVHKRGKKRTLIRIGWVTFTLVRTGEVVLDAFAVYPDERPHITRHIHGSFKGSVNTYGISPGRLEERNGAVPGYTLEKWCVAIAKGRPLVVHSGANDRKAWFYQSELGNPFNVASTVIDTQDTYGRHSLQSLVSLHLGRSIQVGGHGALEDTLATGELWAQASGYTGAADQANFDAMSQAEKQAYFGSFPKLDYEHYQGNIVPGMPPVPDSALEFTFRPAKKQRGKKQGGGKKNSGNRAGDSFEPSKQDSKNHVRKDSFFGDDDFLARDKK